MRTLIAAGQPPHYAELASALELSVEESRQRLRALMQAYPIGWLHSDTDYIASFPPLNGLPTQYRVSVGGEQKWFAQCAFEATAVTWLFPGETVLIDAPCWDCGAPVIVEMRDGARSGRRVWYRDAPTYVGCRLSFDVVSTTCGGAPCHLMRIGKATPFWLGTPAP